MQAVRERGVGQERLHARQAADRTAKLLGVSTPTVVAWIERFAEVYARKPEPEGRAVVVELDEMWHFLKKRPTSSGSGRLGIVLQAEWLTGSAGVVTPPP